MLNIIEHYTKLDDVIILSELFKYLNKICLKIQNPEKQNPKKKKTKTVKRHQIRK